MIVSMSRLKSEIEVTCPCCQAALVVDLNLGRVVSHKEPDHGNKPELGDAHRILADEAALFAAVVLEQHGYAPLVLSFESIDELDHVIFLYRQGDQWGSVARSRDPGLHGRKPVFATPRALALSYFDAYIDLTGRITGYAVVDLRHMGTYDWRLACTNVWKVERTLLDYPHRPIAASERRVQRLRARYRRFTDRFPGRKPLFYGRRDRWTAIPQGNW